MRALREAASEANIPYRMAASEADIPYLIDAIASATGGLAAHRAAAQLAECLATAAGPVVARAHAPALRALAPAALTARRGDATLAHAATLCAVLASTACAAAAPRSRTEIAAVAQLLQNATNAAPKPSPSKRRKRKGFFAKGKDHAVHFPEMASPELARCLALHPSVSPRRAACALARLALRTRGRAQEGGFYGARPVDDRGAARLAFGDAGGVEALGALGGPEVLEAAAEACAGCPQNVSRLRATGLVAAAVTAIPAEAALRLIVDATHLHPPSTRLVGRLAGLATLTQVVDGFDARLLALTALANCLEVDVENCKAYECEPLARRLAALLQKISFDESSDWKVEDVLEGAHCAVPLACVARRAACRANALQALTGAAVEPTALARLLEALAVVQARSGALDRDTAAALAVLVHDLKKLFPGGPPTPEPKRGARQQTSPVGVETPTSEGAPSSPPRTP